MTAWTLIVATALSFTARRDPGQNAIVWPSPPVTMHIQQDGVDDVMDGSDVALLQNVLDTWGQPTCTDFSFAFGGLTPSRAYDPMDGTNTITFLESMWPGFASGAVGWAPEAIDTSSTPHQRVGADVILNGEDAAWATDGNWLRVDVGGVATHELGHVLGLWHSSDIEATMYFASKLGGTHARVLAPDDIKGVCYLYPAAPFVCGTDADCPLFYGNSARTRCGGPPFCQVGAATYGSDCAQSSDCQSNACIEPRYTPGFNPGFCTQTCDVGLQDCPGTDLCSDVSGTPYCYPWREDCVLNDAECGGMTQECVWDFDARHRCLETCMSTLECTGEICAGGRCRPPGMLLGSQACVHSRQCLTLRCAGEDTLCAGPPFYDGNMPDAGPPGDTAMGDVNTGDRSGGGHHNAWGRHPLLTVRR